MQFRDNFRFNILILQCFILLCGLIVSSYAHADIVLKGKMKIGDNNSKRIHPRYLLTANNSNGHSKLNNPRALNPIHFNLTKPIDLTQIRLLDAKSIDASLYFVIWDSSNKVVVNTYSSSSWYANSQYFNEKLPAGDYKLVIVGQCFNRGGKAKGWSNNCGKNWNYEDFSFKNIKLVSPQNSNSITFLQRRHIGDSDERRDDGYGGRWYPDEHEGDDVEYEFTPPRRTNLKSITIYNYRDLITISRSNPEPNNVKLTLSGPNLPTQTTYMNMNASTGDFVWRLNKTLLAHRKYKLDIEVDDDDDADADDISWDDIVLKMGADNNVNINHYRLTYTDRALTCEPAVVTVEACINSYQAGNACVKSTNSANTTLVANAKNSNDVIRQSTGNFIGTTDVDLGYLSADDLSLSLTGINKAYYCNGAASGGSNCDINFADSGFFFSYDNDNGSDDISNQVAGSPFLKPIKLEAFHNDKGQCKNIFKNNETIPVKLGIKCTEPGTCSALDFIADNTAIGKSGNNESADYEPLNLKFNRNGTQIKTALYQDAGKINLIASYTIADNNHPLNGLTIKGSSNQFAVRPYQFQINAENNTATADLTAKNTSDDFINKHKAGESFNFSVSAVNIDGVITTNYQPNSATSLKLKLSRFIPQLTGVDGSFTYAKGNLGTIQTSGEWVAAQLEPFQRGVSRYRQAHYDEVGAIQVNVKDEDYYGESFSADDSTEAVGQDIGRFIPDHFTLVSPDVTNYIETVDSNSNSYEYVFPHGKQPHDGSAYQLDYVANTRVLATDGNVYQCHSDVHTSRWCQHITESGYAPGVSLYWDDAWDLLGPAGSGITYMDQPELIFDYQLEARNAAEVVTQNYDGADATVSLHAVEGNAEIKNRLIGYTGSWINGVYAPLTDGVFSRTSDPDGPFSLLFGINIEDTDAVDANLVGIDMFDSDGVEIAKKLSAEESELRYGRWSIRDGYGPINDVLPVTMQLEYFDGQQFVVNSDDNLTSFTATDAEAEIRGSSAGIELGGSGLFSYGESQSLVISSKNPGEAILEYINTPPWLQYDWSANMKNPTATITFGFFYGNDRVIYRRRLN